MELRALALINDVPVWIAPLAPRAPGWGKLGLAYLPEKRWPGALTGSLEGAPNMHADALNRWGAGAVLSLTEERELTAFPIAELGRAVRERHMHFYHLPIRSGSVPDERFEEGWIKVGAHLRAMVQQGFSIVVHCEGRLDRSAMIIARLFVELGLGGHYAFQTLREFRPGLIQTEAQDDQVMDACPMEELAPATTPDAIRDRAVGALLGLAIGDAMGGQLWFRRPDDYLALSDLHTGGVPKLEHGAWNHVTAAALALSDALADDEDIDDRKLKDKLIREMTDPYRFRVRGINAVGRDSRWVREIEAGKYHQNEHRLEQALMERFTAMAERGCYSWKGRDLDVGKHMRAAARRWRGPGLIHASRNDPAGRGNGSLARVAPVAIRFFEDRRRVRYVAAGQSLTTHAAPEAVDACVAYADLLADAIEGKSVTQVLADQEYWQKNPNRCPKPRDKLYIDAIEDILGGSWRSTDRPNIGASGEAVQSLETALWCIARTGSFAQAVLTAARFGKQRGHTAAIVGQLAGALYGASGIPQAWRERLHWHDHIVACAEELLPAQIRDGG